MATKFLSRKICSGSSKWISYSETLFIIGSARTLQQQFRNAAEAGSDLSDVTVLCKFCGGANPLTNQCRCIAWNSSEMHCNSVAWIFCNCTDCLLGSTWESAGKSTEKKWNSALQNFRDRADQLLHAHWAFWGGSDDWLTQFRKSVCVGAELGADAITLRLLLRRGTTE